MTYYALLCTPRFAIPVGPLTQDLLDTLNQLAGWNVSVVAMSGMTFELDSPHGRMMATMLAGIAQFERDLMSERIKSGLAAAKARGKKLGRQSGQRPKSDRLAPKVMALIEQGRSYRWIARDLGISKNTVLAIAKRENKKDFNMSTAQMALGQNEMETLIWTNNSRSVGKNG